MTPRLDLIGLVVEDMAARVLPAARPRHPRRRRHGAARGGPAAGGQRYAWDTVAIVRSFAPEWTKPVDGNAVDLAFLCDDPAHVDKTHAELVGAGCRDHKEPWDAFWGQRYASIEDPDGNVVDLFAAL